MKSFFLTFIFLAFVSRNNEPEWELSKNEKGIRIYTSSAGDFPVKGIKAQLEFDATLAQLAALVMDVETYKNWVYGCVQSDLLKRVSKTELIYYHVTKAPWPASNRHHVSKVKLNKVSDKVFEVKSGAIDYQVSANEDYVRVKRSKASWRFEQKADGKVSAEYILHFDPAGNVPSWVINLFITDGPYQTFLKMREELKKEKYVKARESDVF